MTTETEIPQPHVHAWLGPGVDGAEPDCPPQQRESRMQRRERKRSRQGLLTAVLICAIVPSAIVLTLWRNLNEPFWFNEQWRAYYISNSANWWRP